VRSQAVGARLCEVADELGVLGPHRNLASLLRLEVEHGDSIQSGAT
jgi:hypothetical protein